MSYSDGRWFRWGGLAGVFVFTSVTLTGVLWHSRRAPDVRGEDAAELLAAAFEREWALMTSADPAEVPPRFGPAPMTGEVRTAEFDVAGVMVAAGSERPLNWTGVAGAWGGPKTWRLRALAAQTDRVAVVRWTLGGASVTSLWTVAGSQSPTGRADRLGDPGGVFARAGFRVTPPVFEGFHDPRNLGQERYMLVSVEPDPRRDWPTNGHYAVVLATNPPPQDAAVWPHMPSSLVWGAASRLRSAFHSRAPAPFWIARAPYDGECAVTGDVRWALGPQPAVSAAVGEWLRSPGDRAGEPAFLALTNYAGLGVWNPDPAVPERGRWRQLTGSEDGWLFTAEADHTALIPQTNLLWECLRAGTNMAAAAAWARCEREGETRQVAYSAQSDRSWLTARYALGSGEMRSTNSGVQDIEMVAWGGAYSDSETLGGYYTATSGYATADGGAVSGLRLHLPPGWPCASACASGLVTRVRVYGFPYLLDTTAFPEVPRGTGRDWTASGLEPAGDPGCSLPLGLPPEDTPGGGEISEWEVRWYGLEPVLRPAALLAELDPAELAGGTGVWFAVETGLDEDGMASFAARCAASRSGRGSEGEGDFQYTWSAREEARRVSVYLPRDVLVVAEFAFGHLAEGAPPPAERHVPAWRVRRP